MKLYRFKRVAANVVFLTILVCGVNAWDIFHDAEIGAIDDTKLKFAEDPSIIEKRNSDGWNPLLLASRYGKVEYVKYLLDAGTNIQSCIPPGWNALHVAAYWEQVEVAKIVIENGININGKTTDDFWIFAGYPFLDIIGKEVTPLMLAAKKSYQIAKMIIDNSAEIKNRDINGDTSLHYAVWGDNKEIIKVLISKGLTLDDTNNQGRNPLHITALCDFYNNPMVDLLISLGSKIESRDLTGKTTLHLAAMNDKYLLIEYLISKGADMNCLDNEGLSPLALAKKEGKNRAQDMLIKLGANQ